MCRCTSWGFPRCAYVLPTYRACTSILPVPPAGATLETKGPGAARGLMHLPNRTLYTHAPWDARPAAMARLLQRRRSGSGRSSCPSTYEEYKEKSVLAGPSAQVVVAPQLIGQCRTERSSWLVAVKLAGLVSKARSSATSPWSLRFSCVSAAQPRFRFSQSSLVCCCFVLRYY